MRERDQSPITIVYVIISSWRQPFVGDGY